MPADTAASLDQGGPILAAFDAIATAGGAPQKVALDQFMFVMQQLRTNPQAFFKELRDFRPILQTPMATLVARFRDVEEILHREEIFSVGAYLPRMDPVIGPFILSQDITPLYDHDISAMRLVARRADLELVKGIVARNAARIVDQLAGAPGPFDIVQTLTRKVPVRLADEYLGFTAATDEQMMGWARAAFRHFFVNIMNQPDMAGPAVQAGAEMRQRLDQLLAERRTSDARKDDVLGRLLVQQTAGPRLGFDDEGVRRTLAGFVIGMVETTSQAAVQALAVLLANPQASASAAAAAKADDDATLQALVFEALRFAPINPMVVRMLKADYLLGAGEPHAATLRGGSRVFALTWSAMFDERIVDTPAAFRIDRPANHYLHFSTGRHTCFGGYISQIQIPQILKPLLRRDGLRIAAPPTYDGTFPESFKLAVGP